MDKYQLAQVDLPYSTVKEIVDMLEQHICTCLSKEPDVTDARRWGFNQGFKHGCIKGAYALIQASQKQSEAAGSL
jgi:hypothetical protein